MNELMSHMAWLGTFLDKRAFLTILLIVVVLVLRSISIKRIRESALATEYKRRWLLQVKNLSWVFLLLCVIIVWGEEIRGLAISLVAVLAAFVLATKELITCFTGAALRAGSGSFKVGDHIEVMSMRGEVIDHDFLSTTLLEIGPGHTSHQRTGRKLVVPNSVFLTHPVVNETFNHQYVLHLFTVPMKRNTDWLEASDILFQAAEDACADYIEDARLLMEEIGRSHTVESSRADPRVTFQFTGADDVTLVVRLAVPVLNRGLIEQRILRTLAEKMRLTIVPPESIVE